MNTVEPIRDVNKIRDMRMVLRGQSVRDELLFLLGINVGLRVSDMLRLRIRDLVKPNGRVKDAVVTVEQKTGKTKKFYLGDVVKRGMETYLKTLKPTMDDFVFKSRKGEKAISRQRAWQILNQAAEMIGLVERNAEGRIVSGEIGTHTLRKTFGYHAYQNGVDLVLLQEIFNHSSPAITLRYIGITEDEKKEVYLRSNLG